MIDHVERYLAIEEALGFEDSSNALDNLDPIVVANPVNAEEAANDLRSEWHLGCDPIPSITALLEERNVRVLKLDLPKSSQA